MTIKLDVYVEIDGSLSNEDLVKIQKHLSEGSVFVLSESSNYFRTSLKELNETLRNSNLKGYQFLTKQEVLENLRKKQ